MSNGAQTPNCHFHQQPVPAPSPPHSENGIPGDLLGLVKKRWSVDNNYSGEKTPSPAHSEMVINGDEADSCGKTDGKVLDWKFIAWGVELAELAYLYLRGWPVYLQFWIRFQASSSSVALETQWKYEAFWIRVGRVGQVSSMSSWTKLSFKTGTNLWLQLLQLIRTQLQLIWRSSGSHH